MESCSPSITEALRPVTTALRLWTSSESTLDARIVISPDGLTVVSFPTTYGSDLENYVFEASNGERKSLAISDVVHKIAFSPDGSKCVLHRNDSIIIVKLSDGAVLNTMNDATLDLNTGGLEWLSNDIAVIILPYSETNNYFELSATGGPVVAKFLRSIDELTGYDVMHLRRLSATRLQITSRGVVDVQTDRRFIPTEGSGSSNYWPEGIGDSWYVLNGPSIDLYDVAGNVIWTLPLVIDERGEIDYRTGMEFRHMRTSRSGRYLAILRSKEYGSTFDIIVLDLNTGARIAEIPIGSVNSGENIDFTFDPTNERMVYVAYDNRLDKWSCE